MRDNHQTCAFWYYGLRQVGNDRHVFRTQLEDNAMGQPDYKFILSLSCLLYRQMYDASEVGTISLKLIFIDRDIYQTAFFR